MSHYEIVFYEKENGRIPVRDFSIRSLRINERNASAILRC